MLPLENVVKEPFVAKQQIEEEQKVILEVELPEWNVEKLQPQVEASVLEWGYVGPTLLVEVLKWGYVEPTLLAAVLKRLLQREE